MNGEVVGSNPTSLTRYRGKSMIKRLTRWLRRQWKKDIEINRRHTENVYNASDIFGILGIRG